MNTSDTITLCADPDLHSAVWAQFVAPVLDGREGFVQQVELPPMDDMAMLFPLGSVRIDIVTEQGRQIAIATSTYHAIGAQWAGQGVHVWLRSTDAELLAKAVAEVKSNAPAPVNAPDLVSIDFWQVASRPFTMTRAIEAPEWSAIRDHYPDSVQQQVAALVSHSLQLDDGRIVLWHGPPGTGKTTAIRALARAWREHARFQVVLDPDAILQHAARLMQVLLDGDDDDLAWRVLVIEDADELVGADAKARVGQALSRLLNVGDGIVGQGLRVLVLITTNERIDRLHPALSRPGRCLAQTEFRRFTRAEAKAWRGTVPSGADDFSLAELMAGAAPEAAGPAAPGLYL